MRWTALALTLLPALGHAATRYVDGTIAASSCTTYSPTARACGGGSDFAWRDLLGVRAPAATAPGDVIVLRDGTYSDALIPGTSGSAGLPITYLGYPGETPTISRASLDPAIDLTSRSHLVIEGLTVSDVTAWLRADGSDYNVIRGNTFRRATATGTRAGVKLVRSNYNRVTGNIIDDGNDNFQLIHSDRNLFEGNTLTRARHNLWDILCGNFNVIRGNDFNNVLQKIGQITDCEGVPADATPAYDATKRNLVESNRFNFTPSSGNASPYAGIQYAAQQGIIRRNVFHDTIGPALDLTIYADEAMFNTDNRVYHNVFYGSSFAGVSLADGAAFAGNVFQNNILTGGVFVANDTRWTWYTGELDGQGVQLMTGRLDGFVFERNDILGTAPGALYAVTYGVRTSTTNPPPETLAWWETNQPLLFRGNLEVAPDFVDEAARDFHLNSASPLIDAAVFLTQTAGAGSGASMPVVDASYFYDGFGIPGEVGDLIKLEGDTATARVTAIDYGTNTLSLDVPLTWTAGQGVATPYTGAAPDIGAFEYSTCSPLPLPVLGVGAVRRNSDVVLTWDATSDPSTVAYDVWKVVDGDRTRIPLANRANAGPAIVAPPTCTGGVTLTCTDANVVSAPPALLFYQVRGACADGTEGVDHPF